MNIYLYHESATINAKRAIWTSFILTRTQQSHKTSPLPKKNTLYVCFVAIKAISLQNIAFQYYNRIIVLNLSTLNPYDFLYFLSSFQNKVHPVSDKIILLN